MSMNEKEGPAAIYTTVSPSALYPGVIREEKCHFFNLVVDSSGLLIVLLSYYVKMVKTILIYSHNSYVTYHDIEITITDIYLYIGMTFFTCHPSVFPAELSSALLQRQLGQLQPGPGGGVPREAAKPGACYYYP